MSKITYNELFDFSNSQEIDKALESISQLNGVYELFINSGVNGSKKLKKAIEELTKAIQKQADTLKDLAPTTNEQKQSIDKLSTSIVQGSEQVKKLNEQLKNQEKEIKKLRDETLKLKQVETEATTAKKKNTEQTKAQENSIKDLKDKIKELTKEYESLGNTEDKDIQKKKALESSIGLLNQRLSQQRERLNEVRKESREAAKGDDLAADSLRGLEKQLRAARLQYSKLSSEERENEEVGGKLLRRTKQLDEQVKSLRSSIGQNQGEVGNYKKAFEGLGGALNNIIQQSGGKGLLGVVAGGLATGGAAGVGLALAEGLGEAFTDLLQTSKEINKELRQAEVLLGGFSAEEVDTTLSTLKAASKEFEGLELFSEGFGSSIQTVKSLVDDFGVSSKEANEIVIQGLVNAQEKAPQLIEAFNEQGSAFLRLGLTAKETFGILATAPQNGIARIEDLSDTVNEFNVSFQRQEFRKQLEAAFGKEFSNRIFNDFKGNGKGALQAISQQIQKVGGDSKEVQELLSKVFSSFGEEKDINKAISLFSQLDNANKLLTQGLTERQQAQINLINSQQQVEASTIALTKEISDGSNSFTILSNKIKTLGLELLIELVQDTKRAFNFLKELLAPLKEDLQSTGSAFQEFIDFVFTVNDAIESLKIEVFAEILTKLRENLGESILIAKEFQFVFDAIGDLFVFVKDLFTDIVEGFQDFDGFIKDLAQDFGEFGFIVEFVGDNIGLLKDVLLDLLTGGTIIEGVKALIALFSGIDAAIEETKNNLSQFTSGFDALSNFDFEKAGAIFSKGFGDIGQAALDAYNQKIKDLTFIVPEVDEEQKEEAKKDAEKTGEEVAKSIKKGVNNVLKGNVYKGLKDETISFVKDLNLSIEKETIDSSKSIITKLESFEQKKRDLAKETAKIVNEQERVKEAFSSQVLGRIGELNNVLFERSNQQRAEQLNSLELQKEQELFLVGENTEAQELIQFEFAEKEKQLRNEQAKAARKNAIFNKALSVAEVTKDGIQSVSKAAAALPFPLNIPGIVAMTTLSGLQLASVLAAPIPSLPAFEKGRKKGGDSLDNTLALVNERGPEMYYTKEGRLGWLGDGSPQIVELNQGTQVLTAQESESMFNSLQSQNFSKNILSQESEVDLIMRKYEISLNNKISYDSIGQAVAKYSDKRPIHSTVIDENGGLRKYIEKGSLRIQNLNSKKPFKS